MGVDDETLEIIRIEGGKAHVHQVANLMSFSFDYARSVLYSLGRRDFIDIGKDEVAIITDKGRERLEKAKHVSPSLAEIEKAKTNRRLKPYKSTNMGVDDEILEVIRIEGGKAHVHRVANLMSFSFDYARSVLYSLGRRDFIDIWADEIAILTDKGSKRLEKAKQKTPTLDEMEKAATNRRMKPYREM